MSDWHYEGQDYAGEASEAEYEEWEGGDVNEQAYSAGHGGYAPPPGAMIDADGRLLAVSHETDEWEPEDYETFISQWRVPWMASPMERFEGDITASKYVWPDIVEDVRLQRIDVFELDYPKAQQATSDREEIRQADKTPHKMT